MPASRIAAAFLALFFAVFSALLFFPLFTHALGTDADKQCPQETAKQDYKSKDVIYPNTYKVNRGGIQTITVTSLYHKECNDVTSGKLSVKGKCEAANVCGGKKCLTPTGTFEDCKKTDVPVESPAALPATPPSTPQKVAPPSGTGDASGGQPPAPAPGTSVLDSFASPAGFGEPPKEGSAARVLSTMEGLLPPQSGEPAPVATPPAQPGFFKNLWDGAKSFLSPEPPPAPAPEPSTMAGFKPSSKTTGFEGPPAAGEIPVAPEAPAKPSEPVVSTPLSTRLAENVGLSAAQAGGQLAADKSRLTDVERELCGGPCQSTPPTGSELAAERDVLNKYIRDNEAKANELSTLQSYLQNNQNPDGLAKALTTRIDDRSPVDKALLSQYQQWANSKTSLDLAVALQQEQSLRVQTLREDLDAATTPQQVRALRRQIGLLDDTTVQAEIQNRTAEMQKAEANINQLRPGVLPTAQQGTNIDSALQRLVDKYANPGLTQTISDVGHRLANSFFDLPPNTRCVTCPVWGLAANIVVATYDAALNVADTLSGGALNIATISHQVSGLTNSPLDNGATFFNDALAVVSVPNRFSNAAFGSLAGGINAARSADAIADLAMSIRGPLSGGTVPEVAPGFGSRARGTRDFDLGPGDYRDLSVEVPRLPSPAVEILETRPVVRTPEPPSAPQTPSTLSILPEAPGVVAVRPPAEPIVPAASTLTFTPTAEQMANLTRPLKPFETAPTVAETAVMRDYNNAIETYTAAQAKVEAGVYKPDASIVNSARNQRLTASRALEDAGLMTRLAPFEDGALGVDSVYRARTGEELGRRSAPIAPEGPYQILGEQPLPSRTVPAPEPPPRPSPFSPSGTPSPFVSAPERVATAPSLRASPSRAPTLLAERPTFFNFLSDIFIPPAPLPAVRPLATLSTAENQAIEFYGSTSGTLADLAAKGVSPSTPLYRSYSGQLTSARIDLEAAGLEIDPTTGAIYKGDDVVAVQKPVVFPGDSPYAVVAPVLDDVSPAPLIRVTREPLADVTLPPSIAPAVTTPSPEVPATPAPASNRLTQSSQVGNITVKDESPLGNVAYGGLLGSKSVYHGPQGEILLVADKYSSAPVFFTGPSSRDIRVQTSFTSTSGWLPWLQGASGSNPLVFDAFELAFFGNGAPIQYAELIRGQGYSRSVTPSIYSAFTLSEKDSIRITRADGSTIDINADVYRAVREIGDKAHGVDMFKIRGLSNDLTNGAVTFDPAWSFPEQTAMKDDKKGIAEFATPASAAQRADAINTIASEIEKYPKQFWSNIDPIRILTFAERPGVDLGLDCAGKCYWGRTPIDVLVRSDESVSQIKTTFHHELGHAIDKFFPTNEAWGLAIYGDTYLENYGPQFIAQYADRSSPLQRPEGFARLYGKAGPKDGTPQAAIYEDKATVVEGMMSNYKNFAAMAAYDPVLYKKMQLVKEAFAKASNTAIDEAFWNNLQPIDDATLMQPSNWTEAAFLAPLETLRFIGTQVKEKTSSGFSSMVIRPVAQLRRYLTVLGFRTPVSNLGQTAPTTIAEAPSAEEIATAVEPGVGIPESLPVASWKPFTTAPELLRVVAVCATCLFDPTALFISGAEARTLPANVSPTASTNTTPPPTRAPAVAIVPRGNPMRGAASTYNPNVPGYRTGGQKLSTGGRYNPNAYEAALQLNLAKQSGCGFGGGKTCFALVEVGNKSLILKINDNGPLVPGRIIDLNEASMRYLSNGRLGNNSGVLGDVKVTLLYGNTYATGPVVGPPTAVASAPATKPVPAVANNSAPAAVPLPPSRPAQPAAPEAPAVVANAPAPVQDLAAPVEPATAPAAPVKVAEAPVAPAPTLQAPARPSLVVAAESNPKVATLKEKITGVGRELQAAEKAVQTLGGQLASINGSAATVARSPSVARALLSNANVTVAQSTASARATLAQVGRLTSAANALASLPTTSLADAARLRNQIGTIEAKVEKVHADLASAVGYAAYTIPQSYRPGIQQGTDEMAALANTLAQTARAVVNSSLGKAQNQIAGLRTTRESLKVELAALTPNTTVAAVVEPLPPKIVLEAPVPASVAKAALPTTEWKPEIARLVKDPRPPEFSAVSGVPVAEQASGVERTSAPVTLAATAPVPVAPAAVVAPAPAPAPAQTQPVVSASPWAQPQTLGLLPQKFAAYTPLAPFSTSQGPNAALRPRKPRVQEGSAGAQPASPPAPKAAEIPPAPKPVEPVAAAEERSLWGRWFGKKELAPIPTPVATVVPAAPAPTVPAAVTPAAALKDAKTIAVAQPPFESRQLTLPLDTPPLPQPVQPNALPTAVTPSWVTRISNWFSGRTTPAVTPTASVTPTTPAPTPSATTPTPTPTVAPVVTPPVPGTPIISPQPPAAQPTVWSDTKLAGRLLRGVALPASTATRNVAVNVVTGSTASLTGPFMPVVWPMLNVGYRSVFNPAYRADVLALMGRARGPVQTTDTLVPATVTPTPVATSVSVPTEISQGQLEVLAGRALTEVEAAELGYTTNAARPGAISREQLEVLTGTTFTDAEFNALVGGGGGTTPPIVPPTGGGGGGGSGSDNQPGKGSGWFSARNLYIGTGALVIGLPIVHFLAKDGSGNVPPPGEEEKPPKKPAVVTPAPEKDKPPVPPTTRKGQACGPNDTPASSGCYPPYVAPGTRGPGNSDVPSPTDQKEKGGLGNSLGQALSGLIGALSKLFGGSQAPQTTPTTPPTTQPTNPPVVTPTPPKPYVTLIANPTSLLSGRKSLLTWSSVNTSSCELFAPGDISMATGTRGSTSTLALATSTLFRLDCSAPSGATTSAKATVTVQ